MLEFVNFYLIPGLVVGSIYALGAIGVSLLFGILRFAHFSHGDMMTLGAYLGLPFIVILNLHPILGAFLAAFFVVGLAILELCRNLPGGCLKKWALPLEQSIQVS